MTTPEGAGAPFTAGAREFHAWSEALWDPVGRLTAEAAAPRSGQRVLDACCGAGASALPAAEAVGSAGLVDAVDLSGSLIETGSRRASEQGHHQVRFHRHDVTEWTPQGPPYDIVQCALGVFFFPDMDRGARALLRTLRPGGRLTLTVWEKGALGAWGAAFKAAVETERAWPSNPLPVRQLERIDEADSFHTWLTGLGLRAPHVERHTIPTPLTPATAWLLALGSGTRTLLTELEPAALARIEERFLARVEEEKLADLDVRILVGTGVA